tara:strand:- start:193 stop:483 length:291 start_codon:yes stop_codon:yes gene_type:complete
MGYQDAMVENSHCLVVELDWVRRFDFEAFLYQCRRLSQAQCALRDSFFRPNRFAFNKARWNRIDVSGMIFLGFCSMVIIILDLAAQIIWASAVKCE